MATLMLSGPALVAAALPSFTSNSDCLAALDKSRSLYNDGDKEAAHQLLTQMMQHCEGLPQIEHNLGVIAASNLEYEEAKAHFHRSLQQDTRAQHTLEQLQAVHAYQASVSYSEALQQRSRAKKPVLAMQDASSINTNSASLTRASSNLHNSSTIEYELYAWWEAAREKDTNSWSSHYMPDVNVGNNTINAPVGWEQTQRQITFTTQDAAVIVSYEQNGETRHRQLLMKLQDNRWKIYQELLLP